MALIFIFYRFEFNPFDTRDIYVLKLNWRGRLANVFLSMNASEIGIAFVFNKNFE